MDQFDILIRQREFDEAEVIATQSLEGSKITKIKGRFQSGTIELMRGNVSRAAELIITAWNDMQLLTSKNRMTTQYLEGRILHDHFCMYIY